MADRDLQTPEGTTLSNAQIDGAIDPTVVQEVVVIEGVPSEEEIKSYKARAVEITSRSQIQAALNVNVPPHLHGEWIPNNRNSLDEANYMGFVFPDPDLSVGWGLHNDGSGRAILGDCVFMVMPKWKKEILAKEAEARRQRIAKLGKRSKEEEEFLARGNDKVGTFNEGESKIVYVTH